MIPIGDGLAVFRFLQDGDNEEMVSTLGIDLSGVGGDFQNAAGDLAVCFNDNLRAQLRDTMTFVGVSLYVGQDGGASAIYEHLSGLEGTASSPGTPSNSCILVRKLTSLAGRRGKGRNYWPGLVTIDQVTINGVINSGTVTALQTAFDAFYDDLDLGPTGGVVGPIPPLLFHATAPFDGTPITGFGVESKIATQRQRMRQ